MIKYILSFIGAGILLTACQKTLSTGDAGFDVTVNTTTLPVGDTLRFAFTGSPDVISFYSGEPGKRYEYRNRTSAEGAPTLRFRTTRANGSQANSLALLVSNDFAGVLVKDTAATISQINSATWTDISSRASFSSGTVTPSGTIDLSDFSAQNKPVFIAFKYAGFTGTAQNKWTIDSFAVTNTLADGTKYVIANMNAYNSAYTNYGVTTYSPGFFACKVSNNYNWSIGSTSLVITGATSAGAATSPAEAWVITGPIDLKKVTPDAGVSIKTVSQTAGDLQYTYKYAAPGTYQVVFSGGKTSAGERHYTTKSFSITVQ
ncbi:DUF5017 domain-containing protein [Pseudoflavitalea sp. X16]|uniref:DUF5017 domain-containing protein n=1 Tax=Paraflavitalea devenefica TaxID=2716334 RepID=UPI001420986B|nr:DUF5017 domain-containing protein [Paraflavitalea devenefica]NII29293.1 DUF5017 domain-containing protein [Paraflavitalea devenefica]